LISALIWQACAAPVLNCARLWATVLTRGRVSRQQNVGNLADSEGDGASA
jgi:hypothetical protein